jgi:hypothetical protein
MNSRVRDRVRLDLDELVDAGLDVAAFCAAASPLVAPGRCPRLPVRLNRQPWYALDLTILASQLR